MKLFYLAVLVLFFNLLFYHTLGTTAIALIFWALYFFFKSVLNNGKFTRLDISFMVTLSAANLFLITRADWFIIFIFLAFGLVILSFYLYKTAFKIPFFNSWLEAVIAPVMVLKEYVVSAIQTLFYSQSVRKKIGGKLSVWKTVARGLVIALPLIFILVQLLSSADPIYGKFISDIFHFKNNMLSEFWERLIVSGIIFVIFLPFLFFKKQKYQNFSPLFFTKLSLVPEMMVVMGLVALTLASFIVIQFSYIFVNVPAEINLAAYGVKTYSEYVKRGFMELLMVAFIVYSAVTFGMVVWRNGVKGKITKLKFIQLIVLLELLIFILSLYRRTYLYVVYHGWSLIRIYGGIFLILLTFMTITLALRHLINRRWVNAELSFMMGLLFICGMFNAPDFISRSAHPPTVNNNVDYVYLSRLSEDGYVGWKKSFIYSQKTLSNSDLFTKPLINKDDRREIAYAAIITNEILRNYNELITQYGNNEEYQGYLESIFNFALKREKNPDEQNRLKELLGLVKKKEAGRGNININFYQLYYNVAISEKTDYLYTISLNKNIPVKKRSAIDRLFIWNFSKYNAYQNMKDDFYLNSLLENQFQYLSLYARILNQPESERNFDFDISLSSPLL